MTARAFTFRVDDGGVEVTCLRCRGVAHVVADAALLESFRLFIAEHVHRVVVPAQRSSAGTAS